LHINLHDFYKIIKEAKKKEKKIYHTFFEGKFETRYCKENILKGKKYL